MTIPDAPKDGDFASYLEARQQAPSPAPTATRTESRPDVGAPIPKPRQTTQQVLMEGEEPSEELLEELHALHNAPDLSDEELARQALEAPGEDGDTRTPE